MWWHGGNHPSKESKGTATTSKSSIYESTPSSLWRGNLGPRVLGGCVYIRKKCVFTSASSEPKPLVEKSHQTHQVLITQKNKETNISRPLFMFLLLCTNGSWAPKLHPTSLHEEILVFLAVFHPPGIEGGNAFALLVFRSTHAIQSQYSNRVPQTARRLSRASSYRGSWIRASGHRRGERSATHCTWASSAKQGGCSVRPWNFDLGLQWMHWNWLKLCKMLPNTWRTWVYSILQFLSMVFHVPFWHVLQCFDLLF